MSAAPSTRVPAWSAVGPGLGLRVRSIAARHPGISGLVLFGALVAICRPASFRTPIGRDTGGYLYVGDVLLHGGTPYLDAAYNKGPLTAVLFAAIRFVAGTSVVGVRLTLLLFAAVAALAVAAYVTRFLGRSAGLMAGVTLAVLSGAEPFPGDDPNTEQYGIAPMAAGWWLATLGGWRSAAAAGACGAAATALNPAFAVVLPFIAFELWRAPGPSRRAVRFGAAIAGGVAVAGPILLWLGLAGALGHMWTQVEGQASGAVAHSAEYLPARIRPTQNAPLLWTVPGQALWAIGITGCAVGLTNPRTRKVALPALLWIFVAWLRVRVASYEYTHHYYPVMPGIAAGTAAGLAAVWPAQTAKRIGLAAMVVAAPAWNYVAEPQLDALRVPAYQRVSSAVAWGIAYPVAEYVRHNTKPSDQLYVSNSHGEVYWLADRRAPTAFFDNFPVFAHPAYGKVRAKQIRRHPPKALVVMPLDTPDPTADALLKTGRYTLKFPMPGSQGVYIRQPPRPPRTR